MPGALDQLRGLWFASSPTSAPTTGTVLPGNFIVRRGYEGPQIFVQWGAPQATGLIFQYLLLRRLYGFPQGPDDPQTEIIYQGPPVAMSISDMNVTPGTYYYYKLYAIMYDGTVQTDTAHQGFVMALSSGFYAQLMWSILPTLYQVSDRRADINGATLMRLYQGPGSGPNATAEVFNIGQDGSQLYGQYQRFLMLFGPIFDEAKGLIDFLINQMDFDLSSITNLNYLAAFLGLNLNTELSPEKMRNEVRLQVPYLKIKGTIPSIISRLRAVSNSAITPQILEQFNNILYSNDPGTVSLQFIGAEAAGINSPNDIIFRSPGYPDTIPFWLWYSVFIDVPDSVGISEATMRKWCVVIQESSPVCHNGDIFIRGSTQDAVSVLANDYSPETEYDDEDEEASVVLSGYGIFDVASYDPADVLLFSTPGKTFSAPDYGAVFPGTDYTTPPTSG
jgi:hypothetical protein